MTKPMMTSTYSVSNTSQSLRFTMARDELKSDGELGSRTKRLCSQINAVLSIISGLGTSVGRFNHWFQLRTKWAGIRAQGTFSREVVLPSSALSCTYLSFACEMVGNYGKVKKKHEPFRLPPVCGFPVCSLSKYG